jgi:uncharacterized membrane protein (DUF485 family)
MHISNRNFKLTIKRISWLSLISFQILSYGSYTILVHLSEENGRINFNSTSLNFLIELLKLTVSLICHGISCFFKRGSFDKKNLAQKYDSCIDVESQIISSNKVSLLKSLYFAFPAVLYCINNNLGNNIYKFFKINSYLKSFIISTSYLYTTLYGFNVVSNSIKFENIFNCYSLLFYYGQIVK